MYVRNKNSSFFLNSVVRLPWQHCPWMDQAAHQYDNNNTFFQVAGSRIDSVQNFRGWEGMSISIIILTWNININIYYY